eukprot:s861_g34.t1
MAAAAAAALPDLDTAEGREAAIKLLDPDFQGLLERKCLSDRLQGTLSNAGVRSISLFAVLGEAASDIRTFAVDHCALDRGRDVVAIAGMIDAWQACKTRMTTRNQAEADAVNASMPPPLNKSEAQDLRNRFEQMHYRLEDKVTPSTGTLEQLFEQIETGEWKRMSLVMFMSRDDQDSEPLAATLDKSGTVKVKRGYGESKPPKSGEELRQRIKLLGHCYLFAQLKFPNRAGLRKINPNLFHKYSDFLLGEHVMQLHAKDSKGEIVATPSLDLVLSYEFQIRKLMVKYMNDGVEMVQALEDAMADSTIKERFFLTPAALDAAVSHRDQEKSRSPRRERSGEDRGYKKGGYPSRSKGSGKGKQKGGAKGNRLHTRTPDGRDICFAWNNPNQRCRSRSPRAPSPLDVEEDRRGTGQVTGELPDNNASQSQPTRVESSGTAKTEAKASFTLRVLYLFAGAERKTSVVHHLRLLVKDAGWDLEAVEIDLKRGASFDLTQEQLQSKVLADIAAGKFHCVICTPPCSTWSRVRMANCRGPPPLRSRDHPWGYPWVKRRHEHEVQLGNELVRFSITVWETVAKHPVSFDGIEVFLFGEHPEDLGQVKREEDGMILHPASIWQLSAVRALVDEPTSNIFTLAINQCCWGAPWRKPTRLLATSKELRSWGPNEWPVFDEEFVYQGPRNRSCNCQVTTSLARTSTDTSFRTTGTDVYPPELDLGIARALIQHVQGSLDTSSKEGAKEAPKDEKKEEAKAEKQLADEEMSVEREDSRVGTHLQRHGDSSPGGPIKCYYKGKHRTIHDGGGLNSPGRWPVRDRREIGTMPGRRIASACKMMFLEWIQNKDKGSEKGVEACFWHLAAGRCLSSPFEEDMEAFRRRLDELLEGMQWKPKRRPEDCDTEVNFRRLKCILEALGDPDHSWLEEVASEGVSLGVDEELPRVPEVFEEKCKWNLSFTDEEFRDTFSDNYKSAEENAEDITRQVMEEVEKGSIVEMPLAEAEETYKGRLAIAALGAVPKELGSSVVRIVHDGSYSVDVNHRIKVKDRMRFPTIDDASGILMHVEDEVQREGGLTRFSALYDVARAHKLLPVKKKDWGYQAFRLPNRKGQAEDKIFLHKRGTFGIASAAYWWQRLAAGLVRVCHSLGGVELGILHLLFADDGWVVATGGFFWRKILF